MAVSDFFVGDVLLDFELRIKDKSKIRFLLILYRDHLGERYLRAIGEAHRRD
jgi:hypothetical protein